MLRKSSLKGFEVPGLTGRLVTSLFADDTSTFLAKTDRWTDLWAILKRWCKASKAKFNDGKTEVIPVGSETYRQGVVATRKISACDLDDSDDAIPANIHIARDGEAVRILGAWIGNKTNQAAIWAPTIKKIGDFLEQWGKCHPSMSGKRHIAQMGVGGISQYLTKVQGMPRQVEEELTKMTRAFLWDGKKPLISLQILQRPIDEG
ncbi:hypothetical protein FOMPIDRAFT_1082950, partial [Fomitopsis schrenkii]